MPTGPMAPAASNVMRGLVEPGHAAASVSRTPTGSALTSPAVELRRNQGWAPRPLFLQQRPRSARIQLAQESSSACIGGVEPEPKQEEWDPQLRGSIAGEVAPPPGSAQPWSREPQERVSAADEQRLQARAGTAAARDCSAAPSQGRASSSGLFRSPTTGGVQSATSAHRLPDPAVAVRNLVAQSKYGHLCTLMARMHHRRKGYPFGCLVDFATDAIGHPIFSLSPLAIHTRNLLADPRCTLVVQIPGWTGLADARATLFGDVYPLPPDQQEWAQHTYCARHRRHEAPEHHWGNSHLFRMDTIRDIYFVGGFGTVAWIDVAEYSAVQPDRIATEHTELTLQVLNAGLSERLRDVLSEATSNGLPVDGVAFISVDSKGVDIRVQQGVQSCVQRLSFDQSTPVTTVEEAEAALEGMLSRGSLLQHLP